MREYYAKVIERIALIISVTVCISCTNTKHQQVFSSDTVIISMMMFNPAEISARAGDTIVFINRDIVPHDITANSTKVYSDTLRVGAAWKWPVAETMEYHCSIHPTMKGKVKLKE